MSTHEALYKALQDLIDDEFDTFKWYLSQDQLEGCRPIPRAPLEKATRTQTVTRLLDTYGPDSAVAVSVLVLQKMYKNLTAQELQQAHTAQTSTGAAVEMGSGPGSGPHPPVPSVTAQGGSVIVAPQVSGGHAGTWNISISR